jgi:pimeloyl-ACP methyl ester carboxylesterase
MGMSRGGWVATWAAANSNQVKFLVLQSAPAVSVTEQEIQRVEHIAVEDSVTAQDVTSAAQFTRLLMRAVRDSTVWEEALRAGQAGRGKRWSQLVEIPEHASDLAWWRRNDYDQAAVLRRVHVPVLALFGTADRIVPMDLNAAPMRQALSEGGNTRVDIRSIPNANHGLYQYGRLEAHRWDWPTGYWVWAAKAPGVFEMIGDWVLRH